METIPARMVCYATYGVENYYGGDSVFSDISNEIGYDSAVYLFSVLKIHAKTQSYFVKSIKFIAEHKHRIR